MSKLTPPGKPSAGVRPLPWDSEFLGFPVAQFAAHHLNTTGLATLINQCRAAGIRLVYITANPLDQETAAVAQQAGIPLADRKVTFAMDLASQNIAPANELNISNIIHVTESAPQLAQLAWQSGEFSRFRLDNRFAPSVFQRLYSRWLEASFTGERAEMVWAALSPAGPAQGLLTLERQPGYASIGLLAVAEDVRGRGIGWQLVETARRQAQQWGCPALRVVTQGTNERACRFYARCGFAPVHETHIYHLWL